MKIAVFHNLPAGGARRTLDQEVSFLQEKHKVRVFSIAPRLRGNRLKRDFLNLVSLRDRHRFLAQKINKNFDFVLVHPDCLTQAPFLLKYLTIPSIYYCQELLRIAYERELAYFGPLPNMLYEKATRLWRKRIDWQNAHSADIILTNSIYTQQKIKKAYGREAVVCYPGVDTRIFCKKKVKKINQLLFVGVKDRINGYDLALRLMDRLGPQFKLKVISGFKLTDGQLAEEYSRSLITLCLSINEPFGLVALESMACQTPVIAVAQGGYKETVLDGKTGYLVKRDARQIADKVCKLARNSKLARRLGIDARKHVRKNFSWGKHNEIINHYCSL